MRVGPALLRVRGWPMTIVIRLPRRRKRKRRRKRRSRASRIRVFVSLALTAGVIVAGILVHLNVEVTSQFEGRLWKLPSRIYSDALVVHPGSAVSRSALTLRLDRSRPARPAHGRHDS